MNVYIIICVQLSERFWPLGAMEVGGVLIPYVKHHGNIVPGGLSGPSIHAKRRKPLRKPVMTVPVQFSIK